MVDCLNQSSKHCGKMPRQQKTDHAKALANLAFWAVLPCISLPVLRLTLLQRSWAQIISGCISHPPVLTPTFQSSCKLPFLWIFVCSVACTHEYGVVTFSNLTVNTWCATSGRQSGLFGLSGHSEGTGTQGQHWHCCHCTQSPTASLSLRQGFLCLLCAAGFLHGIYYNGFEKKRKHYQQLGLLGDSRSQRREAVDELPHPYKAHGEQEQTLCDGRVLAVGSSCVLSTPSSHDSIKWLHGNTANGVFQEFIIAFDVAAITAQSFWSAVISFNNQNDSHSEFFLPLQRQCVLS